MGRASRRRSGWCSAGLFVIWLFFRWEARRERTGKEPLVRPAMLRNRQLDRRPDHVLLPVPRAGGLLLRRPAVPVGLPRALGARRPGCGCCRSRSRCCWRRSGSRRSCRTSRRGSSCAAGCSRCWPGRSCLLGRARRGRGRGDRLRADAPDRARDRRARLAARRRHRLGGARRPEPRGRRRPEHDDEPRRVARHRARRLVCSSPR